MIIRSRARIKQTGEVFTPLVLVDEIISKLPEEMWATDKTFLEPSCGDGNFLVRIIAWKMWKAWDQWLDVKKPYGNTPLHKKSRADVIVWQTLHTTFAVDFMKDNVLRARERMLVNAYIFHRLLISRKATIIAYPPPVITHEEEHIVLTSRKFSEFKQLYNPLVLQNVVWHDALTYHYNFDGTFPDPRYNDQPQ